MTLVEIAQIMRTGLGAAGSRVPRHRVPSWLVRALALARPGLREIVPELGNRKQISNAKAKTVLGWQPRPLRDTILDTSHSLIDIELKMLLSTSARRSQ